MIRQIKIFFILILFFLSSCAKPTVVKVVQQKDKSLNCEELKDEIDESQKIKEEAEYSKDTGGNMARLILFWPAWAQSLHNADEAVLAANNRKFHLIKLMKKKDCKDYEKFKANIKDNQSKEINNNIAEQLETLKELYESGDLSEEEYSKAKKKIID
tara:strand:+ start:485 stop:955 length:471 start_codon:yes stop_codon:yes gene_type:complete